MTPPTFPTELLEAARRRHQRVSDLLQTILEAAAELDRIGITVTGLSDDGSVVTAEAEHPRPQTAEAEHPELARGYLTIDPTSRWGFAKPDDPDHRPPGVACPECGDGLGECCAGRLATPSDRELATYSPGAQAVYKALEQVAGNWRSKDQLATFCQIGGSTATRALAFLVVTGIVQHNGRKRVGSAYRRPARRGGPTPEPIPEQLGEIVPGAEPAGEPDPPAPPPAAKTTAKRTIPTSAGDTQTAILEAIAGAPLTVPELEHGLGIARGAANEAINYLVRTNQAQIAKVPRRDGFPAFEAIDKSAA